MHGRKWKFPTAQGRTAVCGRGHGRAPTTTGRGGPHGQPVVGSIHFGPFFPAPLRFVLLWCFNLGRGFAYVGSFWASFASFLDHLGPQLHLLITCN